jgi:hypothetical protein
VEKGAFLQPDVNEGSLDAGEHRLDLATIDVADRAADVRPVNQELNKTVVLQDGDPGFPAAAGDENLALPVE